ncbi:MAG: SGNH/GDSL hydrolase family protein [Lacisediminihabitans sp.]
MGFFTIFDRTNALSPATIAILLYFARPLLRLHFALYKQDVRQALFPQDDPEFIIAGPDPDRLLFIGDVAVAGYGVLRHGMTAASQTARFIARDRGRGCLWKTIAATDLTAARVARMPTLDATEADAAVIMLGVPDVLLATSLTTWAANLKTIVEHIRDQAGPNCHIVFAGIPPIADFRPIPSLARKMMMLQIQRFNRVTQDTASQMCNASFVRFPEWRVGEMYVQEIFSWKSMHEMWARVLASATSQVMNDGNSPASDSKPA